VAKASAASLTEIVIMGFAKISTPPPNQPPQSALG